MISVEYKCDKCEATWPKGRVGEQLWQVFVGRGRSPESSGTIGSSDEVRCAHWCRKCMVKTGLLPSIKMINDPPAPETPATIEDLIRDIVQKEIG
ncbi:hypothetical protein LCGC14_1131310 [marine sediment metagenome]|uniref:Uncharacterized protein n=1 Tax=marine sediment metagenome TaxID=412755 RepID=A0A0F9M5V2_9ZZZZ